jgi:hypothetical protein
MSGDRFKARMNAKAAKKKRRGHKPREGSLIRGLGLLISPRYLALHVGVFILLYVSFYSLIRFTPAPTKLMYIMPVAYFLYLGLWLVVVPGRKV